MRVRQKKYIFIFIIEMNLPNFLSISRLILIIPIIILYEVDYYLSSVLLFIVASITDFFDGYYARKNNQASEVGALLDLISDKIFVSTLLIWMTFTFDSVLILVSCILIVTRELSISYLRLFLVTKLNDFNNIKSDLAGKIKTSFQMIGLGLVLISPKMPDIFWIISLGILTLSAFLSWYSFFSYINKRRILGR